MNTEEHGLSPARVALLDWTARVGAITAEALAHRERTALASARARLAAAERAGLLTSSRPLTKQPTLYTGTRAGLRAAGVPRPELCRITPANARHAIVCAEVAASLEGAYPDHGLVGERELRHEERERARALASCVLGTDPGGRPLLHRPDLVLRDAAQQVCVAVEVELTVKAPRRLHAICRGWARARCVTGVLYVVPPELHGPVRRAIDRAAAQERIAIVALDALCGRGSGASTSIEDAFGEAGRRVGNIDGP